MLVGFRRFLRRNRLTNIVTKGLLGAVALAFVVVFGAKFFVEYRVGKSLERAKFQAAYVGSLSHGEVNAGLDGRLVVEQLSFRPDAMLGAAAVPLIMEEAVIDFGTFMDMVTASERDLPPQLELSLNGIRLDFGVTGTMVSGNPGESLACGDIRSFEIVDLQGMGFQNARSNVVLGYRLVPGTDRIALWLKMASGDAARLEYSMDLEVSGLRTMLRTRRPTGAEDVRLHSAELLADATRFNPKRNQVCADELGVSVQDAVDANVAAVIEAMATAGWAANDEFLDQYRRFMQARGAWRIAAEPPVPVDLATLDRVDDVNWLLDRFHVKGSVGDQPAAGFAFTRVARPSVEEERAASEGLSAVGRWVAVESTDYAAHIDRSVNINTVTGKEYTGRLLSVTGDEISIRARLPGGEAVVPIRKSQLTRFRVYEVYRPVEEEAEESAEEG